MSSIRHEVDEVEKTETEVEDKNTRFQVPTNKWIEKEEWKINVFAS